MVAQTILIQLLFLPCAEHGASIRVMIESKNWFESRKLRSCCRISRSDDNLPGASANRCWTLDSISGSTSISTHPRRTIPRHLRMKRGAQMSVIIV